MTEVATQQKKRIDQLTVDERARIAHDSFYEYVKGVPYAELGRRFDLTPRTIKRLIMEYSAFIREEKPDTKSVNEEAYRTILRKAMDIIDNPAGHPALLQAKSYEAAIQSLTRLDKLGGHEAPTQTINWEGGETLLEMVTRRFGGRGGDDVSAMDDAKLYEDEIVDAEIVDD